MMHLIGGVVALHGKETTAGDFLVLDVFEAGLAPQIEPQLKSSMI
jgi:DNA polymerase delta subunit 2